MTLLTPPATPASATRPLVDDIAQWVDGVPGFTPVDELFALATLAFTTAHLPGDLVEVGSWHGRSALVLGEVARRTHGRVHGIDLFPGRDDWYRNADGTWSVRVQIGSRTIAAYTEQTVWQEPFVAQVAPLYDTQPDVLGGFCRRMSARGLSDIVVPHRGTSTTFAETMPAAFRSRLVFLDGDHGYEAVCRDIEQLLPTLVPGGWLVLDDAFSSYDGVDRAIRELLLDHPAFDVRQQMTRKCFAARLASAVA